MKNELSQRVSAYIEYVRETQHSAVYEEFMRELEQSPDPENENLTMMLKRARESSPGAKERLAIETALNQGPLYRCHA